MPHTEHPRGTAAVARVIADAADIATYTHTLTVERATDRTRAQTARQPSGFRTPLRQHCAALANSSFAPRSAS